jgi:uncharacterized delta-60 repeat protein
MKYIVPFLLIAFFHNAVAQNFVADPNFGSNGLVEQNLAAGTTRMNALAVASDGSIITAGNSSNFTIDFVIARVSNSGIPDNLFGNAGYAYVDFTKGLENLKTMALQSDGKILVAGSSRLNNSTSGVVSRLLSNGTIDNTFGDNGYLKFQVNGNASFSIIEKIVPLTDGSILVGGYFLQSGVYRGFIRKYQPNGVLDTNFGTAGEAIINFSTNAASSYIFDCSPKPMGKLLFWV